jgi:hypothetical protein
MQKIEGKAEQKQTADSGIKELLELASVCQQVWTNASTQSNIEQLKKTIEKTMEQKAKSEGLDKFLEE